MNKDNFKKIADEAATEIIYWADQIPGDISPFVIIPAMLTALIVITISFAAFIRRRKDARSIEPDFSIKPANTDSTSTETIESDLAEQSSKATVEKPDITPKEVADLKASDENDWLLRLRSGLSKTRSNFSSKVSDIFKNPVALDGQTLESIHEVLYRADIGVKAADRLVDTLKTRYKQKSNVSKEEVMQGLREEISTILGESVARPMDFKAPPKVILVVGVNGVGKTTTIGKLAAHFIAEGQTVLFGAADTFRAAAIDQIKEWGKRLGVDVIAHKPNADPAAVAFDAAKAAKARGTDVLIVDTAGRLHSKNELMDELSKIKRVLGKEVPDAPHEVWLVLDATTGQNAISQAKAFKSVVDVSGLIITKLDGTAKGGVVVGISMDQGLPIRYIGVGEAAQDLRQFKPEDFAASIFESHDGYN